MEALEIHNKIEKAKTKGKSLSQKQIDKFVKLMQESSDNNNFFSDWFDKSHDFSKSQLGKTNEYFKGIYINELK